MVLVAADYADAREIDAAWLRVWGYRGSLAGTVTEALSVALQHLPDAVVMDLSMPAIDGIEATRPLKADPPTRHIQVLATTGHLEAGVTEDAVAAGCDGFIVKPGSAPDLARVVGNLIQRTGRRPPEGSV